MRTPQRQPEILSREELARLFDAAGNLRMRTLLMTAYAAGLRVRWSGRTRDWSPIEAVTLNPERDAVIQSHVHPEDIKRFVA